MKLEYRILWVDDRISSSRYQDVKSRLAKYLIEEEYFEAVIDTAEGVQEFTELLDDNYDLIMTDYHLNDDETGTEIISHARSLSIFTEILFYSARQDLKADETLINNNRVTFFRLPESNNSHDALHDETKKLVQLTIKKFQHVTPMRGLILAEASGLDVDKLEIVKQFYNGFEGKEEASIVTNAVFEALLEFYKRKVRLLETEHEKMNINTILKDSVLFSSKQRADVVKKIIHLIKHADEMSNYNTDVINKRNIYAHAKTITKDDGKTYLITTSGKEDHQVDDVECKQMRKDLIKYKNYFDTVSVSLAKYLTVPDKERLK